MDWESPFGERLWKQGRPSTSGCQVPVSVLAARLPDHW